MSNNAPKPSKRGTGVVVAMVAGGISAGLLTVTYWNLVLQRKVGEADPAIALPMISGTHKPGAAPPASPGERAASAPSAAASKATIPTDVTDLQEQFTQQVEARKFGVAMLDAGKAVVKKHPQSPDAHALHAQILLYDGQFEAARREIEESLQLAPTQPASLVLLGTVYMRQNRPDAAAPAYEKAVAQAPGHAPYMIHLAQAFLTLKEKEKARAICQDVLDRVDSGSGDALTLMADVHAEDGDYVKALSSVQRAIESTPISKRKMQVLYIRKKASLLRRSGKPTQAVMTLQSLTGQELADPEVLEEMARSWEASGDRKRAASTFEKALRTNPTNWELALGAGKWALVAGDLFQARIYADLAQKLNPRSDEVANLQSAVLAAERTAATQPK